MCEKENLKIIVINKPTKEEADKKTKELAKFLENTWFLPLKVKNT